jgi:hypothetical protein
MATHEKCPLEPRELRRYRQFYLVYSRIWESLTPELRRLSSDIGLPVPAPLAVEGQHEARKLFNFTELR